MTEDFCYSNCSVLIPRRIILYSGGDLAAGIILTALLVAGISVVVHVAAFYLIYKKILKPRALTEAGKSTTKAGNDPHYEDVCVSTVIEDVPMMNQNQAYRST